MIIVDSREKKWEHIRSYFDQNGIEYVFPQRLDVGDYFNPEHPDIIIDRKANLQEICSNLSRGRDNIVRFVSEIKRAKAQSMRFIVLIEGTCYKEVKDISGWQSRYGRFTGKWLADKMFNLTVSYDVEWMFCKKSETAKKILEVLEHDSG